MSLTDEVRAVRAEFDSVMNRLASNVEDQEARRQLRALAVGSDRRLESVEPGSSGSQCLRRAIDRFARAVSAFELAASQEPRSALRVLEDVGEAALHDMARCVGVLKLPPPIGG